MYDLGSLNCRKDPEFFSNNSLSRYLTLEPTKGLEILGNSHDTKSTQLNSYKDDGFFTNVDDQEFKQIFTQPKEFLQFILLKLTKMLKC